MATSQTSLMTAEDLLAMPKDDLFHELVRGELITITFWVRRVTIPSRNKAFAHKKMELPARFI